MSHVTDFPAASSPQAVSHFLQRLQMETDCADVHHAQARGEVDFTLLHVVGSEAGWRARHIPGSIWLPVAAITEQNLAQWSQDTLFVVYCAGPHCNGADRAALALARLGRPVKIMLGGICGWEDEGYAFASQSQPAAQVS
ncbi:rhodanese-like domain-containing protein [Entomohabitans teleogrylli]|uniref:rhodanese-like domain-containing protein n=1 Tax=Entomohabitans teleogrylli TaxID=1384589 RepID=UPI00073DAF1B|nr:rhodanese-like domain-containing protein [Entomohabitans teleogrylli]